VESLDVNWLGEDDVAFGGDVTAAESLMDTKFLVHNLDTDDENNRRGLARCRIDRAALIVRVNIFFLQSECTSMHNGVEVDQNTNNFSLL
jgi:hypothetical protein